MLATPDARHPPNPRTENNDVDRRDPRSGEARRCSEGPDWLDPREKHYAEHAGKPFYEPLLEFMMSGPSVAIRLAGNRVIEGFRSLAGTTEPTTAAPGTIRGDFGRDWGLAVQQNLVHGSDSPESAARELEIWFG